MRYWMQFSAMIVTWPEQARHNRCGRGTDEPLRNDHGGGASAVSAKSLGIHMLIFRGANRNKRRGAHNTLMLYGNVSKAPGHDK